MTTLKTLAIAALTLVVAGGATAVEQSPAQATGAQSAPGISISDGTLRLSYTATCLHEGERYSEGARLCMDGRYHNCNSKGLWVKTNLAC
jgi:hypothetical protein